MCLVLFYCTAQLVNTHADDVHVVRRYGYSDHFLSRCVCIYTVYCWFWVQKVTGQVRVVACGSKTRRLGLAIASRSRVSSRVTNIFAWCCQLCKIFLWYSLITMRKIAYCCSHCIISVCAHIGGHKKFFDTLVPRRLTTARGVADA